MSNKEIIKELLERLPEEATLLDIAQEIELLAGIREGLSELDRGEYRTTAQLRDRLREWTSSR